MCQKHLWLPLEKSDLRGPSRRYSRFLAVGIRDCEGVTDHGTAPRETDPAEGVGRNNLEDYIVGLTRWDVGRLRDAVDDVGAECCSCFGFGKCEACFRVHVAHSARR